MAAAATNGAVPQPVQITEDKSQMRLLCTIDKFDYGEWMHSRGKSPRVYAYKVGILFAYRMRNATVLVACLKGAATEVIKNIVLSGIGKLIIVDSEPVSAEDLGSGFFYRDEDVGKLRVDAANARVKELNPLVEVETLSDVDVFTPERLDALVSSVDLVCITEQDRDTMIRINEACRQRNKPFYAGGTYGLIGYIFCDLLSHEHIIPDRGNAKDGPKNIKATANYVPLSIALQYKWTGKLRKPRQTKQYNIPTLYTLLGLWEYEHRRHKLPSSTEEADELSTVVESLLVEGDLGDAVLPLLREESKIQSQYIGTMAQHELSPVCAVVGGMLAQDILKTLAAKEPPYQNLMAFDGITGSGVVYKLNISE